MQATIDIMEKYSVRYLWTGITRLHIDSDEKPWDWRFVSNNSKFEEESFWNPGEPNNKPTDGSKDKSERCVEVTKLYNGKGSKRLNDVSCSHKRPFICAPVVPWPHDRSLKLPGLTLPRYRKKFIMQNIVYLTSSAVSIL